MHTPGLRALACEHAIEMCVRDAMLGGRVAPALAVLERARRDGTLPQADLARWSRITAHAYGVAVDPPLTEEELAIFRDINRPVAVSETALETDSDRFPAGHARVLARRLDLDLFSPEPVAVSTLGRPTVSDPEGTDYLLIGVGSGASASREGTAHSVGIHLRPGWSTPALAPALTIDGLVDQTITVRPRAG